MILRLAALFLTLTAAPTLAASLSGPLAPAAKGEAQCFGADPLHKTCQAMSVYKETKEGLSDTATVLISQDPVITMTTVAPVSLKGDRVCGPVRAEDIAAASFSVAGKPADPQQIAALSGELSKAMKDLFGHEVCVAFAPDGEDLLTTSFMDGAPQAGPRQKALWVKLSDGYQVAP
jgi:hypothetical protein